MFKGHNANTIIDPKHDNGKISKEIKAETSPVVNLQKRASEIIVTLVRIIAME
jgi:hypothetical protein